MGQLLVSVDSTLTSLLMNFTHNHFAIDRDFGNGSKMQLRFDLAFRHILYFIRFIASAGRRNARRSSSVCCKPETLQFTSRSTAGRQLMGNESIRAELTKGSNLLVICGHSHWKVPMTAMPKGVQVLNVDTRVVVMAKMNS